MSATKRCLEDVSTLLGFGGEINEHLMERLDEGLRVFLDDLCDGDTNRRTPHGWVGVKTPEDAIKLLMTSRVVIISLDHDLGLLDPRNGNAVVKWIEEKVVVEGFKPPEIWIHSANSVGVQNMLRGVASIHRHAGTELPPFNPVWEAGLDQPPG